MAGRNALSPHRPSPHVPAPESPEGLVAELSRRHRRLAVCAANDVLRDWALAEDAAQLAFLGILNRLRAGDTEFLEDRAEAAVRRNARWAAMNMRTRRLRRESAEDRCGRADLEDGEAPWAESEAAMLCESILSELPEHYRQAIRLRFFGGLADADAASRLDVTLRAYRRRLDRALARARSVADGIGLRGAAAILLAFASIRVALRDTARRAGELGLAWGSPLAATTALVVLGSAPGAALARSIPPAATPASGGAAVQQLTANHAVVAGQSLAAVAAPATPAPAPIPRDHAAPGPTAWQETPADSSIYSAAAAPSVQGGSGGLVALGYGETCRCQVMFESRDGWHTWRAAPGPAQDAFLARVVLPPAYPADPRIFVSWPALASGFDMVSPGFGQPFVTLPLGGEVTLPPSFERDGGFYVTTTNGMVRLGLDGVRLTVNLSRPAVFLPPVDGTVAAGAPAAGDDAAYALAASSADLAGSGLAGLAGAAGDVGHPVLYRCDDEGRCQGVSAPAIDYAGEVAVSPQFATDHAIAVTWGPVVLLSTDAGHSFTAIPDADGGVT
jgi:RNA polymerase sigma factor (sigma-70 family)